MCKPYSIFKRHTGIYYVQFRMSDGSRSTSKSTGCRTRIEAADVEYSIVDEAFVLSELEKGRKKG